jgi:hypothetical protein
MKLFCHYAMATDEHTGLVCQVGRNSHFHPAIKDQTSVARKCTGERHVLHETMPMLSEKRVKYKLELASSMIAWGLE